MSTPAQRFFEPWQETIDGWSAALSTINHALDNATRNRHLAWRGVTDASYSLHSSLYRRFVAGGVNTPAEKRLVVFEQEVLRRARRSWRFDNLSALEIFAHIQHYGGPTRLLDVTFNPLVALWFAVEQKRDALGAPLPDTDGRMFAFDTTDRQIDMDESWGGRDLPWSRPPDDDWQRGLPRVWRPPAFNERISAQNSAFLLGGVPQFGTGGNRPYRKSPGPASSMGLWRIHEVRAATSVNMRMNALDKRLRPTATPTYTLLINATAKEGIRQTLEAEYGLNAATVYPDLNGLANHVASGIQL